VGANGQVVLSIYVNPLQFGPQEDLARYPRDLTQDSKLCRSAGVDVLFVPSDREMYSRQPGQEFSTHVVEEHVSRSMEGTARPGHFRGVATVVTKLFNIVGPEVAVFGQKDFQQAAVVKRLVRDLNIPIRLLVAPTIRARDGLALSSRHKYLSPDERAQATVLWQAIERARHLVKSASHPLPARKLRKALQALIQQQPAARVDHIAFFDPVTLREVQSVQHGTQLALAVFIGQTRLIDNARL
jgi:pantoate--beta-alanine ligase